jgi:hypothetical protein
MAAALGRGKEKRRGFATARSAAAFFPLRCEHKRQLWLAVVRERRACPWRDGVVPRLRGDWSSWE